MIFLGCDALNNKTGDRLISILGLHRYGQTLSDLAGKIRIIPDGMGAGIEIRALPQFLEAHAVIEPAQFIGILRGIAREKDLPIVPARSSDLPGVQEDIGRAVRREGVIEFRPLFQVVDLFHVVQEERSGFPWREPGAVEIDVLPRAAVVRPQPDEIPFVAHHVDQLVLFEETLEGRIPLTLFVPRFNGKSHVVRPPEPEADHDTSEAQQGQKAGRSRSRWEDLGEESPRPPPVCCETSP